MELKVGMKVVRLPDYNTGNWARICKARGFDPSGVFTVGRMAGSTPIFPELNMGGWTPQYFRPAEITTDLEDWL